VTLRAGARFENWNLVERPNESGGDQQVAEHTHPRVLMTIPLAPILVRVNRRPPPNKPVSLAQARRAVYRLAEIVAPVPEIAVSPLSWWAPRSSKISPADRSRTVRLLRTSPIWGAPPGAGALKSRTA
jgi:hypothetical protein